MTNKLGERYQLLEAELVAARAVPTNQADQDHIAAWLSELEIKQRELKEILLRLIALSSIREEAIKALSVGT